MLNKIVPFFEKYPLRSVKNESFKIFAKITKMMSQGAHLAEKGIRKIVDYAYKMNVGGKYRQRTKEQLLKILQSSETIR